MVAVSSGVPAGLESPDRIAFPWARPVDQVVPDENAATASVAQAVSGSESPADQNVVEQLPAVAVNQRAVALPAQADERRVERGRVGRSVSESGFGSDVQDFTGFASVGFGVEIAQNNQFPLRRAGQQRIDRPAQRAERLGAVARGVHLRGQVAEDQRNRFAEQFPVYRKQAARQPSAENLPDARRKKAASIIA